MNKELASVLRNKLTGLPFVEKLAGLVQTVEDLTFSDDDTQTILYRKRFPVSYDVVGAGNDCTGREKDLQPDSSKKSIIYFEDFGSRVNTLNDGMIDFASSLRLVCWLNRNLLVGDAYQEITAYCMTAIIGKLCNPKYQNLGIFAQLLVKPTIIPAQNSDLFSRYTYDQNVRQYLRPPYEFFGIDLQCTYKSSSKCYDAINFNNPTCTP